MKKYIIQKGVRGRIAASLAAGDETDASKFKLYLPFSNLDTQKMEGSDVIIDIIDDFELPRCDSPIPFVPINDLTSTTFLCSPASLSASPSLFDRVIDSRGVSSTSKSNKQITSFISVFPVSPASLPSTVLDDALDV